VRAVPKYLPKSCSAPLVRIHGEEPEEQDSHNGADEEPADDGEILVVANGPDDAPEEGDLDENEYEEHWETRYRAKLAFANHEFLLTDSIVISQ
jgi:hypothetical protein